MVEWCPPDLGLDRFSLDESRPGGEGDRGGRKTSRKATEKALGSRRVHRRMVAVLGTCG